MILTDAWSCWGSFLTANLPKRKALRRHTRRVSSDIAFNLKAAGSPSGMTTPYITGSNFLNAYRTHQHQRTTLNVST